MKRRVYEKNGEWLMETTNNRGGNASAAVCKTREEAERLMGLADKWERKEVCTVGHGLPVIGRVVNCGLLHHGDGLVDVLYIRWRGCVYAREAELCEIVGG